ncbi:aspartyl/asparaginyl beta-hydroxylase domain-containing protein, partial [Corallococcus praedator]
MSEASPQEITAQVRHKIVELAVQGGYFDTVQRAGPELDRLKQYLRMLTGQVPLPPATPGQSPTIFPP